MGMDCYIAEFSVKGKSDSRWETVSCFINAWIKT